MITQKKLKIIVRLVLLLIIMSPIAYISYYLTIYHPLFSTRKFWVEAPLGHHLFPADTQRNAGGIDLKNNMILILTLPNHHKMKPLADETAGLVIWRTRPKSKSYAEFYSNYGHKLGVKRHKNSFVVVDGITGEELIVHPITIKEGKQWNDEFWRGSGWIPYYDSLPEWSCDFFSIPKEKFLEINEKVQKHDTSNERERGNGFIFRNGKIEVTGP